MREPCSLVWSVLALLFRSRASLEAEILILRHQLNIQRLHLRKRLAFSAMDRLVGCQIPLKALAIVSPETVIRWHRAGFRSYWRWKSRRRPGGPTRCNAPVAMASQHGSVSITMVRMPILSNSARCGNDR
jgi:hypothetical protein